MNLEIAKNGLDHIFERTCAVFESRTSEEPGGITHQLHALVKTDQKNEKKEHEKIQQLFNRLTDTLVVDADS